MKNAAIGKILNYFQIPFTLVHPLYFDDESLARESCFESEGSFTGFSFKCTLESGKKPLPIQNFPNPALSFTCARTVILPSFAGSLRHSIPIVSFRIQKKAFQGNSCSVPDILKTPKAYFSYFVQNCALDP